MTYTEGQAVKVLCYNSRTKEKEWLDGTFISYCNANDMDRQRIEVNMSNGWQLTGYNAAHPDCVKPASTH